MELDRSKLRMITKSITAQRAFELLDYCKRSPHSPASSKGRRHTCSFKFHFRHIPITSPWSSWNFGMERGKTLYPVMKSTQHEATDGRVMPWEYVVRISSATDSVLVPPRQESPRQIPSPPPPPPDGWGSTSSLFLAAGLAAHPRGASARHDLDTATMSSSWHATPLTLSARTVISPNLATPNQERR